MFWLDGLNPGVVLVAVVTLVVAIVVRRVVQSVVQTTRINRALSTFPSMPRHWLYGSMTKDGRGQKKEFFQRHIDRARAHPKAYVIWQGPRRAVLVAVHPDIIRPVLKVSDPKGFGYEQTLKPWLGEGLLISQGQKWARNRRLLTPAFHFDVLRSYVTVFNDITDVFMGRLEDHVDEARPLELFNAVSLLTLDIILQCAFSHTTDCQLQEQRHPYIATVYKIAEAWTKRTGSLLTFLLPSAYWLTADGRHFQELCDIVHQEAEIIIDARRRQLEEQGDEAFLKNRKSLDFLDILLTAKDDEGNGMSKEDIRAEVDTFLFEGHDTTASGISWTLYQLALHPEHQTAVQEEVDQLFASRSSDRLDWAALSHLPVLTRCLKESMRLYPPVPIIARTLTREMDLAGHMVPPGTTVNIPIWALHHNESVWGEDHMEYKPSRFEEDNVRKMDPFAYLPFSAGPRNCIGQTFAMSEEKIVLARLLHRYTFTVSDDSPPVALISRVILRSEQEIRLKVTRRS